MALTGCSPSWQIAAAPPQRGIDSINYNGAIDTAAIQQTVTEQTQKVLDTITGNRMADMQNQINRLQLSQALCGVVRYPNTFAYNAGPSPFCGNGCRYGYPARYDYPPFRLQCSPVG